MSLYVRLSTSFFTHRKTARLFSQLGNDAYWIPPRIWAYAAEHQPDGDFTKYTAQELGLLIGYNGDASSMLEALKRAGFFDEMKIHGWDEHNNYHSVFSERAKKAAAARWSAVKERSKERHDKKGKERKESKHELASNTDATSISTLLSGQDKFMETLFDYRLYRKEIKMPLTPTGEKMLLKELSEHPERAVIGLKTAMNARWRGFNWEWIDNRASAARPNSNGSKSHEHAPPGSINQW